MKGQPDLFLSIAKICEQRLNLAGCDLAEAMSDAVWLSTRLAIEGVDWSEDTVIDKPVDHDEIDGEEEPTSSADSDENSPVEPASGEQKNPELIPSTSGDSAAYVEFESSGAPIPGRRIVFPGVPPLQGARAFERAWRPFAKRIPDAHRMQFDEQATADQIAATLGKVWSIASKPSLNRRWQGIAIFERSPTMRFWHHTLEAFYKTMWQTSAFERLQPAYVDAFGLQPAIYKNPSLTSKVDIRSITNETDNEWLFFFTDFRSNAWLNGSMLEFIEDWQVTTNVVLVHMMQESQWLQSALMQFELTEAKISFSRSSKNKGSIPIFSFEPQSLGQWVGWVMGESGANTSMMSLIPKRPFPDTVPRQDRSAIDSKERMDYLYKRFIQFASEPAQMLARSFASAPLLLPVMRLIQRYEVPDSTSSHLSEILYSGLIKRVRNDEFPEHSKEKSVDPNTIEYDFLPGVRDKLLNNSSLSRIDRVLHLNWEYMQSRYGNGINFNAIIADPSQADSIASYPIANELAPFAKVGGRILQRMGGKQAEAGSSLLARLNPSKAKVVYRPKETEAERLNREYETLKVEFEDGTNLPKGTVFRRPRSNPVDAYCPENIRLSKECSRGLREVGTEFEKLQFQNVVLPGFMQQTTIPSPGSLRWNLWRRRAKGYTMGFDALRFSWTELFDENGKQIFSDYAFVNDHFKRIRDETGNNVAVALGMERKVLLSGRKVGSIDVSPYVSEFIRISKIASRALESLTVIQDNVHYPLWLRSNGISTDHLWLGALFDLGIRSELGFAVDWYVLVDEDDQFSDRISLVGGGRFPRLPINLPKQVVAKIPHQLGYPIESESYITDMVSASVTAINYLLGEDVQEQNRMKTGLTVATGQFSIEGGDFQSEVKRAIVDFRSIEFEDGTNVPKGASFRESIRRSRQGTWYVPAKPPDNQNWQDAWHNILNTLLELRSKASPFSCTLLQANVPQLGRFEFSSIQSSDRKQAVRGFTGLGREFVQLVPIGDKPLLPEHPFVDAGRKPIATANGEAIPFRLGFSRQYYVYEESGFERTETHEDSRGVFEAFKKASQLLQYLPKSKAEEIWGLWPDGFDSANFGKESLWYDAIFELAFSMFLPVPFRVERFVGVSTEHDPTGRVKLTGDGLFPRISIEVSKKAFESIPNQLGYPDYFEATIPDLVAASIEAIEWLQSNSIVKTKQKSVFILHGQDSAEHAKRCLDLSQAFDAIGCQSYFEPDVASKYWLPWAFKACDIADSILVVLSEQLFQQEKTRLSANARREFMNSRSILNPHTVLNSILDSENRKKVWGILLSEDASEWRLDRLNEFPHLLLRKSNQTKQVLTAIAEGDASKIESTLFVYDSTPSDVISANTIKKTRDRVFLSFCMHDERYGRELNSLLKNDQDISPYYLDPLDLGIGYDWSRELESVIAKTRIMIAIVSPEYLNSDFCMRKIRLAMEYQALGELTVLWLSAKSVRSLKSPFIGIQAVYSRDSPLNSLSKDEKNKVYRTVCAEVKSLLGETNFQETQEADDDAETDDDAESVLDDESLLDTESGPVTGWLEAIRNEDHNAMASLVERYFTRLSNFVYRNLRTRLRAFEDTEDISIQVIHSALQKISNGAYPNLSDRNDLWLLLIRAAQHRMRDSLRVREVSSNQSLNELIDDMNVDLNRYLGKDDDQVGGLELLAYWGEMIKNLSDPLHREIAGLKLQGLSNREIATSLKIVPKQVDRIVHRIRHDLERMIDENKDTVASKESSKRRANVLVVGSYRLANRGSEQFAFENACRELGKELIENGFTIVARSWKPNTADYHTLSGANATGIPGKAILVFPTESREADDFERKVLTNLRPERRYAKGIHTGASLSQLDPADVIVAIGGSIGTKLVMDIANVSGKAVIPIGEFGGTVLENWDAQANRLFMDNNLDKKRYGVLRDRFDAKLILQLIDELSDLPKPTVPSEETPKAQLDQSRSLSPLEKRFKVALSFPGEHREFVLAVAEELAKEHGQDQIFYDEWFEVELLGTGGDLKLTSMYETADLIVPFFSKYYDKPWCQLEWETIRGILLTRRKDDAVVPVHMDATPIPGWSVVNFGIRLKSRSPQAIGQVILNALDFRARRSLASVKQSREISGADLSKSPPQQELAAELFDYLTEQRDVPSNTSSIAEIDRRIADLKPYIPKIKQAPTELEQRRFLQQSFATICDYFKKAGELFEKSNAQINIEFSQPDKERFRCEIYRDGKQITGCQIWIGSDRFDAGIHYFQGRDTTTEFNARNETIVVDSSVGAGSLRLKGILGIWQSEPIDKSDPQSTAAILWKRLVSQLESKQP